MSCRSVPTISSSSVALVLLAAPIILAGCDPGRSERQAMREQIKALQHKNAALERQVAALQQPSAGRANDPLAGITGLLGQLSKGNFKLTTKPAPGRATPMNPELQKRLDRMLVDGLEKVSKNKDAKELLKAIMRAMRRDLQRQAAEAPPARR